VVDVGMHIGGFCLEALRRGAGRVLGFEAERSNFDYAAANLRAFGDRARLANKAVWRSDVKIDRLVFTPSYDAANTGGGGMIFWHGRGQAEQEVEAVAFDDVIREATGRGRSRVRLLKIDCEGSEFPILLTSKTLHRIDAIVGEFHEVGGPFDDHPMPEHARIPGVDRFTIEILADALRRAGFDVDWTRHPGSFLGLFAAERTRRPSLLARLLAGRGRRA
ncbi:MAG TPA: FkbM family methyltransferase, partial [Isosphaeraceae bacterium]|nr:FkbM family methyltransferase [Isosphaeraceae bacterium]